MSEYTDISPEGSGPAANGLSLPDSGAAPAETQAQKIARIKRELDNVPTLPGVYLWKDKTGEVIYVGKAKQLRARMRQYVNFQDDRAKIPLLVEQIHTFEYVVAGNEHESLVLERNLIAQYHPFFNADLKDDKSYPFIAITEGDVFPAIKYTREHHKKGTRYFGPYTDSRAAREFVDVARKVVPLCATSCEDWRRMKRHIDADGYDPAWARTQKTCFDCHVGLGPGACCGKVDPVQYAAHVRKIERFLAGNHREFVAELTEEMQQAAENLDFERAGRLKERIKVIHALSSKQHVVMQQDLDADVVGVYREETIAGVQILCVREGAVMNNVDFILNKGKDVPDQDLMHNFLLRYYGTTTSIPREVVVAELPEDRAVMEQWLTEQLASAHGAKVRFSAPKAGEKRQLLQMAQTNAKMALLRYKVRTNYEDKRTNEALLQLESALALDKPPMRIECFDISTIHGSYTVASMVVFTNGKPDKSQYRRFKIKTPLTEANDFVSMQEVMSRRYAPERMADERFGKKPDLIILDGGKPQLSASMEMFDEMGIHDIALCGLAKRDEEIFVPWAPEGPIILPSGSASLYLVKHVRDEAHRFAITFHRELRGKGMTASILDEVEGLGPKRKKALYKAFGSLKNMRAASLQELEDSHAVPKAVAEELYKVLKQYNGQETEQDATAQPAGEE